VGSATVYRVTLSGRTISGAYVDVPAEDGDLLQDPSLDFEVRTVNGGVILEQPEGQQSVFEGRRFEPCDKTIK
jgi:hypothetical protein